jgi:hypothetical protein
MYLHPQLPSNASENKSPIFIHLEQFSLIQPGQYLFIRMPEGILFTYRADIYIRVYCCQKVGDGRGVDTVMGSSGD